MSVGLCIVERLSPVTVLTALGYPSSVTCIERYKGRRKVREKLTRML